ncbi:RusA family crossover junction endodeoxyribonuclease [Akkermansia muciniphila]|uniref:RusA family crossover junction endodeoxyribonuclease n=1 Tax=Akkermansia muciniphila TaxID=239935 RepID=UPI00080C7647|nr:RusA family crossover junction endodeoxyribonuclease [Akkermansia muciniphila]ANU61997.1 hypothetical protein A4V05_11455 [Akkermansia muciniphila]ASB35490.1 RusA family crossover junction endodeoxyribonuclease [Akkermansia muciniphila]QQR32935.1 RusA family crossover junction endodeoxyribonuclease [Akkermansia muciniphila]WAK79050.1 RusA-like holliday junction resolvase [Akkermansia phage Chantilly]
MNKPITIMLPIVPPTKTHQNKKIVNIGKHAKLADTKELKLVISDYLTLLKPYQPARPLTGPVSLKLAFVWPYRKSEPKKKRIGLIPKTTKPDWDNLAKTLQDVLTRLRFWEDDAQVYSASVDKWWGEEPQITITVQEGSEQ